MPEPPLRLASAGWPRAEGRVPDLLRSIAAGAPPPSDGLVEVVPQADGPVAAVLAFDGHHVVAADVDPAWVHARLAPGELSAPMQIGFIGALAEHLGRRWDNLDAVWLGIGEAGDLDLPLLQVDADHDHPRAVRSQTYRRDSVVYELPHGAGLLVIARGLAGRWEAAFEVEPAHRGRGWGRRLVQAARRLVPPGEPVFLQVAPGNVSSTRAVLAAGGFAPIGAEVLLPGP
ncbi:MAG: GNAT family N-acetyltransferase [Acidimicrobiales bacterium]